MQNWASNAIILSRDLIENNQNKSSEDKGEVLVAWFMYFLYISVVSKAEDLPEVIMVNYLEDTG